LKRLISYIFLIFAAISAQAQCAMCRAVLESEAGQTTAKGRQRWDCLFDVDSLHFNGRLGACYVSLF
jgi:hypothetical protein